MKQKEIKKSMDILITSVLKTKAQDNITAIIINKVFKL
jgi:serine/threonine protein phosphatase PrpC